MKDNIKLLLVFKKELFRIGLGKLLEGYPNLQIEGCSTASEAFAKLGEHHQDVVLLGAEKHEMDPIELAQKICRSFPTSKVILFSVGPESTRLLPALKAGATGYVTSDINGDDLAKAIFLVADNELVIGASIAKKMLDEFAKSEKKLSGSARNISALSKREQEILVMASKGATNREIANALFISENTVKVHMRNILSKLHIHSRRKVKAIFEEINAD